MRSRLILIATLLMVGGSAVQWYIGVSAARAHVEASLNHWRQAFKKTNPNVRIQWDAISIAGFPFSRDVRITNPTLSVVVGTASFGIGFTDAILHETPGAGGYALLLPKQAGRAVYGADGQAPEEYTFTWNNPVQLQLAAYQEGFVPVHCSVGEKCRSSPTLQTSPMSHYRIKLPDTLLITATLRNESQQISFNYSALERLALAQERAIPKDIAPTIQLAVGVLREALIYTHPQ